MQLLEKRPGGSPVYESLDLLEQIRLLAVP